MTHQYSKQEIALLREGGRRLALIMQELEPKVVSGIIVHDIELAARHLLHMHDCQSATIGYRMDRHQTPFPSAACVSVNDEVVHVSAYNNSRVLEEGDVVSVDMVVTYQGMFVDICRSWAVGALSFEDQELLRVARLTTDQAITQAVVGNTVDDIGRRSQEVAARYQMTTARELGGHGVGKKIHMAPFIPNFGGSGFRDKIRAGMVLAIEPIVCLGDWRVQEDVDGWRCTTVDGNKAAQFEETVLVTEDGPEILTQV